MSHNCANYHKVLKDGYTQGEVARYLDVSAVLVSYVFRSLNDWWFVS